MTRQEREAEYRKRGYWRPETLARRRATITSRGPGGVAILEGGRSLSYGEIDALVERLAGHLASLGVGPGDVVSWQLPNWWEAVVVHHAALRLGAVPNPLNAIFRARELRFVLPQARPKVLIAAARMRRFDSGALAVELAGTIDSIGTVITARGRVAGATELEFLLSEPSPPPPPAPENPAADALLLYTSGSTGDPKGVRHSHETLLYEMESLVPIHDLSPEDRYLGGAPVSHIAGLVYGLLMPFALGTSTTFIERWEPARALEAIERDRATFQTGTPTFLQTLAEDPAAGRRGLSSFRLFSTGGASIPVDAIIEAGRRLGCVVKRAYGSTEVPTLTGSTLDDSENVRLRTDGRVIRPGEIRIVRRDGVEADREEEGEILARSPEVFRGYANPSLDAGAFDGDGWVHTGDLGLLDEEKRLRVTGRLQDVIIRGGENISAREVEDLLQAHSAISEVAVVGLPDDRLGEKACAVVVLRKGFHLTFEEMAAFLQAREIAMQKIPERLEFRTRLPRTASGKVQKAALREALRADTT